MVVGKGEKTYSRLLPKPLLGGTSCWDDRPPKRGNFRGNRWVHALRVEREMINIVVGRKATAHRGTKQVRLCLARVGVVQCGRQVHPYQTKAVKGQDRKTLATAGAIKRPLPCPVEEIGKQSIFYKEKKKKSKKKRKKIRAKTEKKRKETKKEKRELVQWACTNRSVSLSPPSNLTFFQNANKDFSFGAITIQGRLPQSH